MTITLFNFRTTGLMIPLRSQKRVKNNTLISKLSYLANTKFGDVFKNIL